MSTNATGKDAGVRMSRLKVQRLAEARYGANAGDVRLGQAPTPSASQRKLGEIAGTVYAQRDAAAAASRTAITDAEHAAAVAAGERTESPKRTSGAVTLQQPTQRRNQWGFPLPD